jgi:outer membrane protein
MKEHSMKKIFLAVVVFSMLAAVETKIGFVDSDRVFLEYQATAAAKAEFNLYVNEARDSAAVLRQNIETLKEELETQKLMLSEEARLRKLDEIESLSKAYDQYLQSIFGKSGRVQQKNDELMVPILDKVNESVAKIADREGFTVVLELSENILYASSELDITDLVIDELNLEYGPQIIPGEIVQYIAIFPLREENPEAVNADLGQRCQNDLYTAIAVFSQQYQIVAKQSVNSEIVDRGFGRNVDDTQAYTIAKQRLWDYIIVGSVTKVAARIDYTLSLKMVAKEEEVFKQSNSVTEDIKLTEALTNDLRVLIDKIK